MGPAVQDLWMLITDNQYRHQWNILLEGYEDFREFDDRAEQDGTTTILNAPIWCVSSPVG